MTSSFADANITVIIDYISCLCPVMYGSHLPGSCFAFLDTLKYGGKHHPKHSNSSQLCLCVSSSVHISCSYIN